MSRHKNEVDIAKREVVELPDKLENMNINSLRCVGKKLGVRAPTTHPRDVLLKLVLDKLSGKDKRKVPDVPNIKPRPRAIDPDRLPDDEKLDLVGDADRIRYVDSVPVEGYFSNFEKHDGYVSSTLMPSTADAFVLETFVNSYSLKRGDYIEGRGRYSEVAGYRCLLTVEKINGIIVDDLKRVDFELLDVVKSDRFLSLWHGESELLKYGAVTAPFMFGQRGLISCSGPAKTLPVMAALSRNMQADGEFTVLPVFYDCGPEYAAGLPEGSAIVPFDATDTMKGYTVGLAAEFARRQAEAGRNVVIIADRLDAAYAADRQEVMRLLSSARRTDKGSVTVIAAVNRDAMDKSEYASLRNVVNSELYLCPDSESEFSLKADPRRSWAESYPSEDVKDAARMLRSGKSFLPKAADFAEMEKFVKALLESK